MYLNRKENKINMAHSEIFTFCKITTLRFWLRDFTLFHIRFCQNYKYGGKFTLFRDYRYMVVVSFEPKTF